MENRKFVVEAAVMRIMKSRKTLSQTLLLSETAEQVSPFFKPSVPFMKHVFDILIDKEYLERDPDNPDVFRYVS